MKWVSTSMGSTFLRKLYVLVRPYWSSEEKWAALLLLAAIMAMNLGMVYVQVLVNQWTRDFYNVLQTLDKALFLKELMRFVLLATAYIIQAVYMLYLNQMLQIRWRRWLTGKYLSNWLHHHAYYRMQFLDTMTDNPDQRISEDIKSFIDITLTLGITLVSAVATLISFVTVLWHLSGTLEIPLGSMGNLSIPGYMVWASLLYSILGTWLTMRLGNPLVLLNFNQQRFEADFRFSMVRLRENSESVALYAGERQEEAQLSGRFKAVVDNFWKIMKRQKRLAWLTNGYGQAAVIFPVVMAAPRFFSGQIHLGGLMQTAGAFGAVHGALSYLVNSYTTIAGWHAVIDRLTGFSDTLERIKTPSPAEGIKRGTSSGKFLQVDSLSILLPDSSILVKDLSLAVEEGASLLISGPSGCGKSTLIRTIAGIWPFGYGTILMPEHARAMFLPQKPYLPLGTLRDTLLYPYPENYQREGELREILVSCGLSHLVGSLSQGGNWSHALSLGEQQRIAFARLLLHRPDYMFLDEATASLDEPAEADLYQLIRSTMPHAAVVSVGHRSTLLYWHRSRLAFVRDGTWAYSRNIEHPDNAPETLPRVTKNCGM